MFWYKTVCHLLEGVIYIYLLYSICLISDSLFGLEYNHATNTKKLTKKEGILDNI